ncbi:MAG TPA: 23S rRNA (guanosine(2251)-2'-O)-methyltransferase RlmB [Acidimicrobiales bacterium]|nr:23S rRNA (guanosine(2251)-2'-O)-methyltransferase RlmB [Acidimicrobiales bacterium]
MKPARGTAERAAGGTARGNGLDLRRAAAQLGGEQVEGHHAVRALFSAGKRRATRLWVAEPRSSASALAEIVELARSQRTRVDFKSTAQLASASLTAAPQGVIAWASPVRAVSLDGLVETSRPVPFLVVLDGVTDPGNFGALLRSAACAGATGVIIRRHRAAPLTAAAMKAAAGAAEVLPIAQVPGIPAALGTLAKAGIWVAGLEPGAGESIWSSPLLDGPVAIVLGSEGEGLSRLVRERCDSLLEVPQAQVLGSLNVSAAAAVGCFEVARRRLGRGDPKAGPENVQEFGC